MEWAIRRRYCWHNYIVVSCLCHCGTICDPCAFYGNKCKKNEMRRWAPLGRISNSFGWQECVVRILNAYLVIFKELLLVGDERQLIQL